MGGDQSKCQRAGGEFHGKLRDECLRVSWFANLFEARRKIAAWRKRYNQERPHSSLGYRAPGSSRAQWAAQKAVEKTGAAAPWKTLRVSHFPTATTAAVAPPALPSTTRMS